MLGLIEKVIGSANDRAIKRIRPLVQRINELEPKVSKYTDAQLQAKTAEFKAKIAQGTTLDELLPIAFAVVREAGKRVMGMRHYDVQLIGGIVLHQGKIAEMRTGEGKTLVATLPVYLNALAGKGVHVVTVNDYLASRDAEWMGQIYRWLGLTVGTIVHDLSDDERRRNYACDITYGTNNEFGFDYLRDNMKFELERRVQRGLHYCIVDEVDSILIDESRTPLIISGPAERSSDWYYRINAVIPFLKREQDFLVDEKGHTATLTDSGVDKVEARLKLDNLYDVENIEILHHVHQALKAHTLYKKDVNYVVENGKVIIVDEFTGRKMEGRRWSDGLHQAVEAKEGVRIEEENETLATITFQNYFRLYDKLAGMTGTADTEAAEFAEIYKLDVVVIPTNKPVIRKDENDLIYKTEEEKWRAVARNIQEANAKGQPVLVGTTSVEKSEYLSSLLRRQSIEHSILNAKFHAMEADIVAQAGRKGAVTIATNMAGRGTDIILGGNPEFLARQHAASLGEEDPTPYLEQFKAQCEAEREEVLAAGGLHIVGTERHESRRVDNQLRGRAGRQGDPGSSRFFLSLDDDLMRIFGSDRLRKVMETLRMPDDEPIEHKWVTKAVENAQKKIEGRNFDIRKNLLKYDDVMDLQRKAIYGLRDRILVQRDAHALVLEAIEEVVYRLCDEYMPEGVAADEYDLDGLEAAIQAQLNFKPSLADIEVATFKAVKDAATEQAKAFYLNREKEIVDALRRAAEAQGDEVTPEVALERWRYFEQERYLRAIDTLWKHHLKIMDALKEGIHLEAYGQKNPEIEYKKQGFELFETMLAKVEENVTETLFRAEGPSEAEIERLRQQRIEEEQRIILSRQQARAMAAESAEPTQGRVVHQGGTYKRSFQKIGRNDPCPCGSGKKFKKCHLGRESELEALLTKGS